MIVSRIGVALALLLTPVHPLRAQVEFAIQYVPPVTVQVQPGVSVKYLALERAIRRKSSVAVILFAGGNGLLNLQPDDAITTGLSQNFLVRSRAKFAQKGLFVALVDTPNQVAILGNVRLSADYAADMASVIQEVRSHIAKGKVWLVGTSSGTISAANIAARLPHVFLRPPPVSPTKINLRRPDGIVLTSTQTTIVPGVCGRTVFDTDLSAINIPVLVVSHQSDACGCSPPTSASNVIAALNQAASKQSISFTGGGPPQDSDPCEALTFHGFLGVEDAVVDAIADWIAKH
ncbi:MAG TPA: hypothetical protein VGF60_15700 [Xanthobacteraceae bacterium]|jgi:hypothetical protein